MTRVLSNTETRSDWLTFEEVRQRNELHALRDVEVPTEHAVSLPMPTLRWTLPGFAFFASPALLRPRQPVDQDPPDRWWLLDARTARLLVYARVEAVPFHSEAPWGPVLVDATATTLAELDAREARIGTLMDDLLPAFYAGGSGDWVKRHQLAETLVAHIAPELMPQYRALVPDFFSWLER